MKNRFDVIVSGGGMVGSAAALALARVGYSVAMIEPVAAKHYLAGKPYELRVSALSPSSIELLRQLNVWHVIKSNRISPYKEMKIWHSGGDNVLNFSAQDYQQPILGCIVENSLVQWSLVSACHAHDDITVIESRIESFNASASDVIVSLENGQQLICRLLAGADGQQSVVRGKGAFERHSVHYLQSAVVCNVTTEHANHGVAYQRFLEDGVLAFLPLVDGSSSIVWSTTQSNADALLALSDDDFCDALGEAFELHLGVVTKSSPRASFPLVASHTKSYVKQGLALLGDAAHTIHPLAGQGVNLGFGDVESLARALTESKRSPGSLHVLRKFERERRSHNEIMLRLMDLLQIIFYAVNPVVVTTRNIGLGLINRLDIVKKLMVKIAFGQK